MATFKYISKDMSAKTIRGTLEADDRNDLVRKLKEQNLFLVSCQDVTKKTVNQYKMKLNELLKIKYPIIQGGMANIATGEFAASVSNAGGLGLIGSGGMNAKMLKEEIQKCKKLTDQPFGVNIMLLNPEAKEMAQIVIEEQVPIVTTGAGNPGIYMKMWKEAGIKVIPVVASVALARRMERCGADAVVAEGCESGGHIGENTTMVLVPQIVDAVKIPVIAAGGIADGRGMAAAFMLGAKGVQMGTHFIVTDECQVHNAYKERILKI